MKLATPLWIAAQVALGAPLSQTVSVASPQAEISPQHFVCNTGYTMEECKADIAVLRKALANYPLAELGEWTWVLVRSEDWKAIVLPRGIGRECPAFTYYEKRETFIEEALVTQVPVRSPELLLKWNMDREGLLDLAIRHELGHALCNEPDERNAERVAKLLEQRKPVSCEVKAEAKQNARHHASLN
jgi:hypothetical protein